MKKRRKSFLALLALLSGALVGVIIGFLYEPEIGEDNLLSKIWGKINRLG